MSIVVAAFVGGLAIVLVLMILIYWLDSKK